MTGVVVLGLFCGLLFLRIPISMAILLASTLTLIGFSNIPLLVIPQYLINGISAFEILAVPLFILAAEIMNAGGLTTRIFKFALACVGWMRGGLAQVNIVASVIFAGISGTAVADAAGLGRVEIRAMQKAGYDLGFSCSVTIASCLIGPLIPPSVPMIIYALTAEVSVGAMLLAGVGPGLLLAALLMAFVYYLARSGWYACPTVPLPSTAEWLRALWEGLPALLAPVLILAGIVSGWLTVTEAGIGAVLYTLAVSLVFYGEMTWRRMAQVIVRSTLSTAMVMFLVSTVTVMTWIVTREQVGVQVAGWFMGVADTRWVQLLMINLFLIVVGTAIDGLPALLVLVPILLPIATEIGLDPVHFGVILVFNLLIGIITPPVGMALFVVSSYTGLSVERLTAAFMPFYIPLVIALLIITYVPAVSLALPRWLLG